MLTCNYIGSSNRSDTGTSSTSNGHVVANHNTDAPTGSISADATVPLKIPKECSDHHDSRSADTKAPVSVAEKTPCM